MRELSAARDARDVCRHVLRVLALQQVLGHAALAGAPDADGVLDALLGHLADPVEVGAGDASGVDGREAVAARAGLAEDRLAVGEVPRDRLARQRRRAAL